MSISLRLGDIIAHVKNIADSTRCTFCDKADGGRIRYVCGHTSCDDCLIGTGGCMLCLTPPNFFDKPLSDEILSQRVQNACNLLKACQDTFNLDVYRRLRVSEQLRAEKDFFPKCIQAPLKYCNKRKSITTVVDKENLYNSFHPGEHISPTNLFKMKKSNNYVQQWLENSEIYPRKALGDLSVNKQNNTYKKKTVKSQYQNENNKVYVDKDTLNATKRKRNFCSTSFSLINRENDVPNLKIKRTKKSKLESHLHDGHDKKAFEHTDNEESGIVLDDEPILIEDSPNQVIDKDKLALLAVQVADKERSDFISLTLETTQDVESLPPVCMQLKLFNDEKTKKVPFYKKSSLAESCFYCKLDHKLNNKSNKESENVSITIENQHFITTINILKHAEVISDKKSVVIQTNLNDVEKPIDIRNSNVLVEEENKEIVTADIRKNEIDSLNLLESQGINKLHAHNNGTKKEGIIINDSDSNDTSIEGSFLQVTAEVHRSCEPIDYGILNEISTSELPSRSTRKVRCITPDSNNSSDKENCDPNKSKKHKNEKKSKYPKKLQ